MVQLRDPRVPLYLSNILHHYTLIDEDNDGRPVNCIYIDTITYYKLRDISRSLWDIDDVYLGSVEFVFKCLPRVITTIEKEKKMVVMNTMQRAYCEGEISYSGQVQLFMIDPHNVENFKEIVFSVKVSDHYDEQLHLNPDLMIPQLRSFFGDVPAFINEQCNLNIDGVDYKFQITNIKFNTINIDAVRYIGRIVEETKVVIQPFKSDALSMTDRIVIDETEESKLCNIVINPLDIDVGGLSEQFQTIYRRAIASRVLPKDVMSKFGAKPVKGMLFYGPPGTGKTHLALQLSKHLNASFNLINATDLKNRYFGETEKMIRDLFKDARDEYSINGDRSRTHILVIDEIDSLFFKRDEIHRMSASCTNQLLSELDGVDKFDNIIVIGITNRKDTIDEALLRPGRLELHIEFTLPDEQGRKEIFEVHVKTMRDNNMLSTDVDLDYLAKHSEALTGAEISGVVRTVMSNTMMSMISDPDHVNIDNIKITQQDFINALNEIKESSSEDELNRYLYL